MNTHRTSKLARVFAASATLSSLLILTVSCGDNALDSGAGGRYQGAGGDATIPQPSTGSGSTSTCDTNPRPGCGCDEEGAELACGQVEFQFQDHLVCGQGYSTCSSGKWGECKINNSITVPKSSASDQHSLALGGPSPCVDNPCTPKCTTFPDDPTDGIPDPGTGVIIDKDGVSLPGSVSDECKPKTCASLAYDCGPASDGCGKLLNCGTCSTGFMCGSSTKPNVCTNAKPCLTGLCNQQVTCSAGTTTSISGTVYAPNGVDPIPNVVVYVNDGPVDPFPTTITCEQCTKPSGKPLVSTTTDVYGKFKLDNMPVGANIPLVIQIGRWRRQVTIPNVKSCQDNPLDAANIRLPKKKSEGNIPKMAMVTGSVDAMECVLRKIGIDDSEFTNSNGSGRINFFAGAVYPGTAIGFYGSGYTEYESVLLGNPALMSTYDVMLFPCQGDDYRYTTKSTQVAFHKNIADYMNAGGRGFFTHFSYMWIYRATQYPDNSYATSPLAGAFNWSVGSGSWGSKTGYIDMSFPKGLQLANWLKLRYPTSTLGQISVDAVRKDYTSVVSPTQSWMTMDSKTGSSIHATFNTPLNKPPAEQCGRTVFSDFHVEDYGGSQYVFPGNCSGVAMTPQEKLLEYMLFDLSSCIEPDVPTSTCTPLTCAQQGLQCGPAGDGCGGTIQCGTCTAPETCGGGGLSGVCGAPLVIKEGSFARDYDMTGQCKQGESITWGLWSWDALTPGDSKIAFEIQTADTAAGLTTATKQPLRFSNPPGPAALVGTSAIAKTTPAPNTQKEAAMVDTTLKALGMARTKPFLRVTSRLIPNSTKTQGPTLKSWNLQAYCSPSE